MVEVFADGEGVTPDECDGAFFADDHIVFFVKFTDCSGGSFFDGLSDNDDGEEVIFGAEEAPSLADEGVADILVWDGGFEFFSFVWGSESGNPVTTGAEGAWRIGFEVLLILSFAGFLDDPGGEEADDVFGEGLGIFLCTFPIRDSPEGEAAEGGLEDVGQVGIGVNGTVGVNGEGIWVGDALGAIGVQAGVCFVDGGEVAHEGSGVDGEEVDCFPRAEGDEAEFAGSFHGAVTAIHGVVAGGGVGDAEILGNCEEGLFIDGVEGATASIF